MPVQIKWLRTARQNLDDEATYIAQEDAAASSRVVARVLGLWPSFLSNQV